MSNQFLFAKKSQITRIMYVCIIHKMMIIMMILLMMMMKKNMKKKEEVIDMSGF